MEGLKSPDGIAAHCRRSGISKTQFYTWQRQILENADALFEKFPKSAGRKLDALEEELEHKDHIIAVVTEQALDLKKNFSD